MGMPEVADLGREDYCLLKNEHILRLQVAMGEAILVEKLQTVPRVYAKPPHELISVGPNQRAAMLSLVLLGLGCARFADRTAEVSLLRGEGMKSELQKRLWADSWKMLAVALCSAETETARTGRSRIRPSRERAAEAAEKSSRSRLRVGFSS